MLSEFGFIEKLKNHRNFSRIGDDCAVLPKDAESDLVVTADMLVENVDFKLEWATPEDIGHKALAVSLSDIAAMGATPVWSLISIAVPENLWNSDFVDRFYDGYCALADRFDVEIAGGDISRSPDGFVVDSTAGGQIPHGRALLRSGAKVGDTIYVSGTLGAAAAGLRSLVEKRPIESLLARQLRPFPRIELGRRLFESGMVTAMIDISDGLSGDLGHLCRASGVGAIIEAAVIPADPMIKLEGSAALELALHGGEDFELLFTAPKAADLVARIEGITAIGRITDSGVIELASETGRHKLTPDSFRHF